MAVAEKARIMGQPSAKLWIVVMSDFQCPYCKRWHDETDAVIRKRYVETGKARYAFLNFPLRSHRNAVPAAEAAMCAGEQGKFWPVHDALFDTQDRWGGAADPGAVFDSVATAAGLDLAKHRECRTSGMMRGLIDRDARRGAAAGVQGTPAFSIGTQKTSGALPTSEFVRIIEEELAKLGGSTR
jgi:protein-disulfide isomerase